MVVNLTPFPPASRPGRDVTVLFDWENAPIGSTSDGLRKRAIKAVLHLASRYGRVVDARAYADWQSPAHLSNADDLSACGVTTIGVATPHSHTYGRRPKNGVDIRLAIDAIQLALTTPGLGTCVLVSGDGDFIHLVESLQERGCRVVVIGRSGSFSHRLKDAADEYWAYDLDILPTLRRTAQPTPIRRTMVAPPKREPSRGRPAARSAAAIPPAPVAGFEPAARLDSAIEDVEQVLRRIQQRGDSNTLADLKKQLIAYRGEFDQRSYGFATFTGFMAEAERRGALHVFASRAALCAYLPNEPIGPGPRTRP